MVREERRRRRRRPPGNKKGARSHRRSRGGSDGRTEVFSALGRASPWLPSSLLSLDHTMDERGKGKVFPSDGLPK